MAQEPMNTDLMKSGLLKTTGAGVLREHDLGAEVQLAGWVARRRDHGGVIFIDLRDSTGFVQVVLNPEEAPAPEDVLHGLRIEYCVQVMGTVRQRPEGTVNPDLPTGAVEVVAQRLRVLSTSEPLPFPLDGRTDIDEGLRLQYRYLDMRRDRVSRNLRARSKAIRAMRNVMDEQGFLEVETPTLIASTPEGARDMLVPSRLRQGQFYALPQSPQLFKQLLMIGGVERYYQIARCYRDEDFRADRQVEFTQLDFEGAFWGQEEVLATIELVARRVVADLGHSIGPDPFVRMTYAEAMESYGSDKPDVRFDMKIVDLSEAFTDTDFKAFAGVLADGGSVRGINGGQLGLARAGLDALVSEAQDVGAKGLVWMVVEDDGSLRSPVAKFLSDTEQADIASGLSATPGDTLLIVADHTNTVLDVLGRMRLHVGQPDGHDELAFVFVVDFPVFEVGEDGALSPAHHPFTAPADLDALVHAPETAVSKAYDLVLNGSELGSGSVRIHDAAMQAKVFEVMGISDEDAEGRFGWFLEALRYGTPPHAGFALGVARFVSILQGEPNIREVIPFPKTQTGADPLTGSPSRVKKDQLEELGICVAPDVVAAWAEEADSDPPTTDT
ncbi:MAG: aspartate--tRNA ligase [Acidimicrobiia bacterium]|nr:aspartate--tRNA ligase [Acidimicrobiia bacterium]